MATTMAPTAPSASRTASPAWIKGVMEAVLLLMVVAAPWLYGAVHPGFELLLDLGVLVLLALWALRIVLERQLVLARCPVTIMLSLLLLLGLFQLTPLPNTLIKAISPHTAELYARLWPEAHESLPAGLENMATPRSETLSLYPAATQAACLQLLALLLVFMVVRNNLGTPGAFTRLAFVLTLNGTALCVLAIAQYFSSPRDTLYWTHKTQAQVFGPFVGRNIFPFYVNLCIAAGLGLILARTNVGTPKRKHKPYIATGILSRERIAEIVSRWLEDPASVWLTVAVAFMACTVAFSLSRGGVLALGVGLAMAVVASRSIKGAGTGLATVAVLGLLALFFLGWLGLPAVERRLDTIWTPETADTSRIPCWLRVLPLVADFPIWGTGFGTFRYVELWARQDKAMDGSSILPVPLETAIFNHAHNDYVEMVVEMGIPGLLLALAIIITVYRCAFRAIARHRHDRCSMLAAGAVCGVTAVVVHSIVDFGMRVPAVALLMTVVCATLCALGEAHHHHKHRRGAPAKPPSSNRIRIGGFAPAAAACLLVVMAMMIVAQTYKAHRVERLRGAAAKLPADTPRRRLAQLPYLEAVARLEPNNAQARFELAQLQLELFQEELQRLDTANRAVAIGQSFMMAPSLRALGIGVPPLILSAGWNADVVAHSELVGKAQQTINRERLHAALGNVLAARNANPLLAETHLTLGIYGSNLPKADPPRAYFDRVAFLTPRLPDVWYYSGLERLARREEAQAWDDWRRCLGLSDRFLDPIMARGVPGLSASDFVAKVLPDRPEIITKAGARGRQWFRLKGGQCRFWKAALQSCERQPQPLSLSSLRIKAQSQKLLGDHEQARLSYRQLLARNSDLPGDHIDLAWVHWQLHEVDDARRELGAVLGRDPRNVEALRLEALINASSKAAQPPPN